MDRQYNHEHKGGKAALCMLSNLAYTLKSKQSDTPITVNITTYYVVYSHNNTQKKLKLGPVNSRKGKEEYSVPIMYQVLNLY